MPLRTRTIDPLTPTLLQSARLREPVRSNEVPPLAGDLPPAMRGTLPDVPGSWIRRIQLPGTPVPVTVDADSTIPRARAFVLFNQMFLRMISQLCLRLHDRAQRIVRNPACPPKSSDSGRAPSAEGHHAEPQRQRPASAPAR